LSPEHEARGLIDFIKNKVKTSEFELTDFERDEEFDYEKMEAPECGKMEIDDLQVGDIILSTTRWPSSAAIRILSGSKVSHAVLYIGNGEVVEALKASGVVRKSVESAIKDDKYAYALRYPGLTSAQQQVMRDFAVHQVALGTRFDLAGMVFRAGLRIPGGGDKRFYCSEFVLKAYETAGIPLFETTQKRPGDIDELRGTKLSCKGYLKMTKKQSRQQDQSEFWAPEWGDIDDEFELDEFEDEFEYEGTFDDEDEFEDEFEYEYELDNALEDDTVTEEFADRLHELSMRSFESEFEFEMELDGALDAMENEFMVKRLCRKKKRGKRKSLFKKIVSTGAKIAGKVAGKTPIGSLIKAGTSLVNGHAKTALKHLGKAVVGTALGPVAGTVATTAIDALGGGEGEISRRRKKRRAIRRVARIARDAYREVADTLPEDFDHPLVAGEVARKAVRKSMLKHGVRPPARAAAASRPQRIIQLKPGEMIVVARSQ
jgi:hypothetical protein